MSWSWLMWSNIELGAPLEFNDCLSVNEFASELNDCLYVDEFASELNDCLSVNESVCLCERTGLDWTGLDLEMAHGS